MQGEKLRFNPFGEAIDTKFFVGRGEELRRVDGILAGINNGYPAHGFVAGLHGTGKTFFIAKAIEAAHRAGLGADQTAFDEKSMTTTTAQLRAVLSATARAVDDGLGRTSNLRVAVRDLSRGEHSALFVSSKQQDISGDAFRSDLQKMQELLATDGIAGVLVCIDEGQRILPSALSTLKNSIQAMNRFALLIALRLSTETPSVEEAGRSLLNTKAADAEGDFGASALFSVPVAMGPFENDAEAIGCIQTRLRNNSITFSEPVLHQIPEMTGRFPRRMMELCAPLWAKADALNVSEVNVALLHEIFTQKFTLEVNALGAVCSQITESGRRILRLLATKRKPLTQQAIIDALFSAISGIGLEYAKSGTKHDLEQLARSGVIIEVADTYEMASPAHGFAAKLALEAWR
jgi:hypothetical protein